MRSLPRFKGSHLLMVTGLFLALSWPAQAHAGRYLISLLDATIAPKKGRFARWDTGFGSMTKPDVYVILDVAGQRMTSTIKKNSITPKWNISRTFTLKGNEKVYIQVRDKDGFSNDDLVGKISIPFRQLLTNGVLSFGKVKSLRLKVTVLQADAPKPRPVVRRPVVRRPVVARPVVRRPVVRRPVVARPVVRRPVVRRPVTPRPVVRRPEVRRPEPPPVRRPEVRRPEPPPVRRPEVRRPEPPPVRRPEARRPEPRPVVRRPEVRRPEPPPVRRPEVRRPEPPPVRRAASLSTDAFCVAMLKQSLMCLDKQHTKMKASTNKQHQAAAQFIANLMKKLKANLNGPNRAALLARCAKSLKKDGWKSTPGCLSCLKAQGCVSKRILLKSCNSACTGGAPGPAAKPMIVPASLEQPVPAAKKKVK